jgi:hypothetical protein
MRGDSMENDFVYGMDDSTIRPTSTFDATTVITDSLTNDTSSVSPLPLFQGDNQMAEVDTTQLSQEHGAIRHDVAVESARLGAQIGSEACAIRGGQGDIRREQANGFADTRYNIATNAGDIRREIAGEHCKTNDIVRAEGQENVMAIKDTRHDVLSGVDAAKDFLAVQSEGQADRIVDRVTENGRETANKFFDVGRDTQDIRAQIISAQQAMVAGFLGVSKDTEISALKVQVDAGKNTTYLADKIERDGEKTRALINDLKYHDLNRGLVERNTALVNCEQDRDHWRHRYHDGRFDQLQAGFQGQWAQLQSQIQAFQSQLQETRQGMVNFGTMAGVGQSSTSNNVR